MNCQFYNQESFEGGVLSNFVVAGVSILRLVIRVLFPSDKINQAGFTLKEES